MSGTSVLAERGQVRIGVVGGVVLLMGGSQYHPRGPQLACKVRERRRLSEALALPVAPSADLSVPPTSVAELVDDTPVRVTAALAGAASAPEPDHGR